MFILASLSRLATSRTGLLLLAGFLALQAWWIIHPSTPPLDPARAAAADRVAEDAASALTAAPRPAWSGRYVAVAPLAGDDTGYLRGRLEEALQSRSNCRVITDTLLTELRAAGANKLARLGAVRRPTADAWKPAPVTDLSGALKQGRRMGADYVVYGALPSFRLAEGGVSLSAELAVAEVAAGAEVLRQRFVYEGPAVLTSFSPGEGNAGAGLRLVLWALFVLLLPLATAGAWNAVLERESAGANAAAVLFLTLAAGLLAWALMGFTLPTVWAKAVLGVGCLASFTWNLAVLSLLDRRRCEAVYES